MSSRSGKLLKPVSLFGERARIYHGECSEILKRLRVRGHIITDAPFEDETHKAKAGTRTRKLRTDGHAEPKAINFKSITGQRDQVIGPMVNRCSGWLLVFCSPEGIAPWRDAIEGAGARYKRACFYFKTDAAPQFNGQGPGYAVEPFVAAWCAKGYSRWNGGGGKNVWDARTNNPDRQGEHETEKPISLMMDIIRDFTNPGDTIIDPFMGSGTTGIAALALGRKFVGIEADERYFKLGVGRLKSMNMGRMESKVAIAKLLGADNDPGPLFAECRA